MTSRFPGLLSLALVLISCAGNGDQPLEASGTVEATTADIGFPVPGRIASLAPREGARVVRGQELGWLDTAEAAGRWRSAAAQRDAARALLREVEAGPRQEEVRQVRLALASAERRLEEQVRETGRTVRLAEGGAVSREQRERAETALAVAQAERDRVAEQLALLEAGSRPERIAGQRAAVAQAEALLAQAAAALEQMRLVAPFDGIVTVRHREPGEVVGAGMPALTIMDPADRWIRVYVAADQVGRLALGEAVTVHADGFPDQTFRGEVAAIATEAEFTPRNVQTAEERVRLVHAVRVRVVADPELALKPGLAADVRFGVPPA